MGGGGGREKKLKMQMKWENKEKKKIRPNSERELPSVKARRVSWELKMSKRRGKWKERNTCREGIFSQKSGAQREIGIPMQARRNIR